MEQIDENEQKHILEPCHHAFHVGCIIKWVRLNPACPVCRDQPVSAAVPTATFSADVGTTDASHELATAQEAWLREHRNYVQRRNRLARQNKHIGDARARLKRLRNELRNQDLKIEESYRQAERRIYAQDEFVKLRKDYTNVRRNFLRLNRRYKEMTESILGPEPIPIFTTRSIELNPQQMIQLMQNLQNMS